VGASERIDKEFSGLRDWGVMLAKIRMLIHEVDEQKLTRVEKLSIPLMTQYESCL
jgi:hypothetical protein